VRLTLDSHPGVEYAGRVAEVGRSVAGRAPGLPARVVSVRIDLEATDGRRMRPGMRFRGRIETERLQGVLLVPAEAVALTAAGPRATRRRGLALEAVEPRLGAWGKERIEVLSGLAEGDLVLLGREEPPR
jgi:hypothetical protein